MIKIISIDEVLFLQSDEKCTRVVTATNEAHVRKPLTETAEGLDQEELWQMHRGIVVRATAMARPQRDEMGRIALLPSSRRTPEPRRELGLRLAVQGHVIDEPPSRWNTVHMPKRPLRKVCINPGQVCYRGR